MKLHLILFKVLFKDNINLLGLCMLNFLVLRSSLSLSQLNADFLSSGIVETAKSLNTTFITSFRLEIVAKDGFYPPAVSNRTTLTIHVTKTPSVKITTRKAGTTSLEAVIDISEFAHLKITSYQVLVQEYKPEDSNCTLLFK